MVRCQYGIKTGMCFIPLVFNACVNDLILTIQSLNRGIQVSLEASISNALYADDIVHRSESEANMQIILNYLGK